LVKRMFSYRAKREHRICRQYSVYLHQRCTNCGKIMQRAMLTEDRRRERNRLPCWSKAIRLIP
jgi:uncharacterized Zn finger protein